MATLTRQRIRIAGDAARFDGPRDLQSNGSPVFWRGNDVQFEIAVFNNGVLMAVSNLASITLEIKALGANGAPPAATDVALMSTTISAGALNNALILADWTSGVDQHGIVAFSGAESNIAAGQYWLAVWATTNDSPGRSITLAAGPIEAAEDGVGLATVPQPPQEVFYTATQSDARFASITHAASHTDGSDDIQSATTLQKGLMASADKVKLDGIESGATADQTGAEIKTAYEAIADTNAFTDAALRRGRVAYHLTQTGLL